MPSKKLSLAIGRRRGCAGITVQVNEKLSWIGILCQSWRSCSMPSVFSQVFSTLDLKSGYHYLPLFAGGRVKIASWELDHNGNDQLYHWNFFHLASRMHLLSFKQWWTTSSLACPLLGVTLIMWSFWARHHISMWGICKPSFERLRRWGLRLHHGKCKFFHDRLAYLGYMIIPWGLRVQQTKVDAL